MSLLQLTVVAAAVVSVGCLNSSTQIPGPGKEKAYPVTIKESPERRARAEREWRRMLETYNVPQTPPDLHPIIYTPRTLLGVQSGIAIIPERQAGAIEPIALREALKGFFDRWRDLFGASSADLSLVSAEEQSENTQRLSYRQSNYPYPVVGGFGEMVAVITQTGLLKQFDDRVIPLVEVPPPQLDRQAAAQRVGGRTFTYSDIAGGEQRAQVGINEVTVKQLVIFPVEKGNAIEVYLAWEVTAGSALSWTIFVDALTGEELRTEQNFKS
jgi:hypothetical protein